MAETKNKTLNGIPTICIVGDPGAGKTRLAALYPDALCLDIEKGGASAFRDTHRYAYEIGPDLLRVLRADIKKFIALPYKDKRYDFKGIPVGALVIDSLDALQQVYKVETLLQGGTKYYREPRQMWGKLLDDLIPLVFDTKKLKVPVIWVAHVKSYDPIFENGVLKSPGWRGIATQGAIAEQIMRWFDYCLHIYVEQDSRRKCFVQPTIYDHYRLHAAKDRHNVFTSIGKGSFIIEADENGFPKSNAMQLIYETHTY